MTDPCGLLPQTAQGRATRIKPQLIHRTASFGFIRCLRTHSPKPS
jgi:hypothetical protein